MSSTALGASFGWLHLHPDKAGDVGVVLCPAFAHDGCAGYRPFRQLAEALAAAGYPTLRFDYPGTGDSCEPDGADLFAVWKQSIHDAADWLRDRLGLRTVVLGGLRFGATLAAVVAAERHDVAAAALLAPNLRGRAFIRQLTIEANMQQPGSASAEGLVLHELILSAEAMRAIGKIDLRHVAFAAGTPVAVFSETPSPVLDECVAAWGRAGARVDSQDFVGFEAMLRPAFMCHEPGVDTNRFVRWLIETVPATETPAGQGLGQGAGQGIEHLRPAELRFGDCVETPLWFGPDEEGRGARLFGMLCRPLVPRHPDLAVLIVNSSGNPHFGYARLAVRLARHLAEHGIASLRMDFAGLGDSRAEGDAETHCFATSRCPDISAAIDALQRQGYAQFGLQGLCSGAYHAFHGALADARVGSLVLINLPLFQWREGDPVEYLDHAVQSPALFLPKLTNPDVWRRLLSGQLDVRARVVMTSLWCVDKAKSVGWRFARMLGFTPPPGFAEAGMNTLAGRTRTLFLATEGDDSVNVLAKTFGTRMPAGSQLLVLSGVDHSITGTEMQRIVADHIAAFVTERPEQQPAPAVQPVHILSAA
jgi:pimeloyl-ACP methyl ester carboxylesterase